MNSRGFVVTSSQAMVDSAVMRSPTSASAAPMFEDSAPSDGSGDMDEQWHATGKERLFDSVEADSEIFSEMAEVGNSVELGVNMGMRMDQGVSGNASRSMERGVDVGRESDAKSERSSAMSKSGASIASENLALEDAEKHSGSVLRTMRRKKLSRLSIASGIQHVREAECNPNQEHRFESFSAQPPVTQSVSPAVRVRFPANRRCHPHQRFHRQVSCRGDAIQEWSRCEFGKGCRGRRKFPARFH